MAKRSRSRDRRKAREQQRQRRRQLYVVGALVVIAVVILGLMVISNQPADAPISEGLAENYADLERNFTEEGYPRLGSEDAPVRVVEYSSFTCPHCATFHEETLPSLIDRVRSGEISFTFVPVQLAGGNSEGATRMSICAGEQGQFWEMHDVLFDWQRRFVNTAFSDGRLRSGADAMGFNTDALFNSCFFSDETTAVLIAAQAEGITSTPTITVNGVAVESPEAEVIHEAIDNAIPADWQPPSVDTDIEVEATEEAGVEITAEADAEATDEAPVDEEGGVATDEPSSRADETADEMEEAEATETVTDD